jgi:hypothetical protein
MIRSLLLYFAWISLVMIAFSCRAPKVIISGEQAESVYISIDSGSFEKTTLKAKVIYKDEELTGRILIKKIDKNNYRVAFYNEMGMTYLEGTLDNNKLIIHNIIPVLDNKIFLRKFEKSMKAIL